MSESLTVGAIATLSAGLVARGRPPGSAARSRSSRRRRFRSCAPRRSFSCRSRRSCSRASTDPVVFATAPTLRFALALLLVALPALVSVVRNGLSTGHYVLSDRGGLALAVRAALDEDVARFGARTAALTFTPWERARAQARAIDPESTLSDYRPEGSQNFLLRTYRRFEAEREREGGDFVAVDRRLGREALARFGDFPGRHLVTAIVVGWRGLFAERSPGWTHPFDLALPLGLLLGFAVLALALIALRERDVARLLFVAPALILAAFHIAATEFLPRYTLPLLPLLWGSVVLLGGRTLRHRRERAAEATAAPETATPDASPAD